VRLTVEGSFRRHLSNPLKPKSLHAVIYAVAAIPAYSSISHHCFQDPLHRKKSLSSPRPSIGNGVLYQLRSSWRCVEGKPQDAQGCARQGYNNPADHCPGERVWNCSVPRQPACQNAFCSLHIGLRASLCIIEGSSTLTVVVWAALTLRAPTRCCCPKPPSRWQPIKHGTASPARAREGSYALPSQPARDHRSTHRPPRRSRRWAPSPSAAPCARSMKTAGTSRCAILLCFLANTCCVFLANMC